jgi:hypothetical protein
MATYVWDKQSHARATRYKKADAESVGVWLEALRDESPRLKARDILNAARDPESPGHACFTWDDRIAGEKWREQEAQAIMLAIRKIDDDTGEPERVFVNITDFAEASRAQGDPVAVEALPGGYVGRNAALSNPAWRARLEARGYAEFVSVMRRFKDLGDDSSLGPIFKAIREAGERLAESPDEEVRQVAAAWA